MCNVIVFLGSKYPRNITKGGGKGDGGKGQNLSSSEDSWR